MKENNIVKYSWITIFVLVLVITGCDRITDYNKTYQLTGRIMKWDEDHEKTIPLHEKEDTEVVLRNSEGTRVKTTKTEGGKFSFVGLEKGDYSLDLLKYTSFNKNRDKLQEISLTEDINLGVITIQETGINSEPEKLLIKVENSFQELINQYKELKSHWNMFANFQCMENSYGQIGQILKMLTLIPEKRSVEGTKVFYPGKFTVDYAQYMNSKENDWLLSEPEYEPPYPDAYQDQDIWHYKININNYFDSQHFVSIKVPNLVRLYSEISNVLLINRSDGLAFEYNQKKEGDSNFCQNFSFSYTVEESEDFSTMELDEFSGINIRYPKKVSDLTINAEFNDNLEDESRNVLPLEEDGVSIDNLQIAYDLNENTVELDGKVSRGGSDILIEGCKLTYDNLDLEENILGGKDKVLLNAVIQGGLQLEAKDELRIDLNKLEMNRSKEFDNPESLLLDGCYQSLSEEDGFYFDGEIYGEFDPSDFDFDLSEPVRFLTESKQELYITGDIGYRDLEKMSANSVFKSKGDSDKSENITVRKLILNAEANDLIFNLEAEDNQVTTDSDGIQSLITNSDGEVKAVIDSDWRIDFFPDKEQGYSRGFDFPFN